MWKKNEIKDLNTNSQSANGKSGTVIGQKVIINGEVSGSENLLILGVFEGNIRLNKSNVTIGKTGHAKGVINSQSILVEGKVEGDLKASERTILRKTANVKGNIVARSLVMDDCSLFDGNIKMLDETAKPVQSAVAPNNKLNQAPSNKRVII